jgi:hypothetical protein
MQNKKQMIEMVRKVLKHSQGLHDPKIMHPEREWLIGLGLALIIFVCSAYGSIYTYWKNKNIAASNDVTVTDDAVVYRESVVKEALSRFDKRNKEREALMATFPGAPTPAPAVATSSIEQGSTTVAKVASSTGG